MPRIKLCVAYDGTDYAGWQIQDNAKTVQGEIEKALSIIYSKEIRLHGSGRTDAGVHALRQYAHYDCDKDKGPKEDNILQAINFYLPSDIRIRGASFVNETFHARFNAVRRRYCYIISCSKYMSPFMKRYAVLHTKDKDVSLLNKYASFLIGEHDFTSFCSVSDANKTKIRTIYKASFTKRGDFIYFYIEGNAFLQNMVRIIVGTIFELERKGECVDEIKRILLAKSRFAAGPTAAAEGLFLTRVVYKDGERGSLEEL